MEAPLQPQPKITVITGGSRGIGAATARLAAERGHTVAIAFHNRREAAAEVVDEIVRDGGKALAIRCDVTREEDVERLFATVDSELGPVTGLVNNAGILDTQCRVDALDAARIRRIFDTNVLGCFLCARQAVLRMSRRNGGGGGAIVNVSSVAARTGSPGEYVDYAASKGAVDSLTVGLAGEVANEGIRVNAVRPGFVDTEIHASGGEPDRLERVRSAIPLGRPGQPSEVAEAILWLLDHATYSTGTLLDVAGGR